MAQWQIKQVCPALLDGGSESHVVQRERLEQEGVLFNLNGRIDLQRYGW